MVNSHMLETLKELTKREKEMPQDVTNSLVIAGIIHLDERLEKVSNQNNLTTETLIKLDRRIEKVETKKPIMSKAELIEILDKHFVSDDACVLRRVELKKDISKTTVTWTWMRDNLSLPILLIALASIISALVSYFIQLMGG